MGVNNAHVIIKINEQKKQHHQNIFGFIVFYTFLCSLHRLNGDIKKHMEDNKKPMNPIGLSMFYFMSQQKELPRCYNKRKI